MSARNFYIMQSAVAPMQSELPCYTPLTNHRTEVHTVPLVMATDYAALEAECDALRQQLAERGATIERLEAGIPRLQEQAYQARKQRDKLAGLLERARGCIDAMGWDDLETDIDAAVAEIKP